MVNNINGTLAPLSRGPSFWKVRRACDEGRRLRSRIIPKVNVNSESCFLLRQGFRSIVSLVDAYRQRWGDPQTEKERGVEYVIPPEGRLLF